MPCCTLIAFLLSQLGIAGSAIKVRMSGAAGLVRFVPSSIQALYMRWRWAGLATALTSNFSWQAPPPLTSSRMTDAPTPPASFRSAWHLCLLIRQPSK